MRVAAIVVGVSALLVGLVVLFTVLLADAQYVWSGGLPRWALPAFFAGIALWLVAIGLHIALLRQGQRLQSTVALTIANSVVFLAAAFGLFSAWVLPT